MGKKQKLRLKFYFRGHVPLEAAMRKSLEEITEEGVGNIGFPIEWYDLTKEAELAATDGISGTPVIVMDARGDSARRFYGEFSKEELVELIESQAGG